jgi:tetratricopeptide (TPR) repeat protein
MTKKLLAALFCFSCLATAACADAKKDCANAKIHPAQIVKSCTKVIQADPTAAWAFVNRAKNYPKTNANFGKIIGDFTKAIEIEPHNAAAFLGRAQAGIAQSTSMMAVPANNPDYYSERVLPDLNAAIAIDPEFIAAIEERGWYYSGKDEHENAVADFGKVISRNPERLSAYGMRGLSYRSLGKYDLAIADFDKEFALTRAGTRNDYETRGLTHSLNGNDNAAIADYKRAIASGAEFSDTKLNLAYAYFNTGDFKAAAKTLNSSRETVGDVSWKLLRFMAMRKAAQHLDPAYTAIDEARHYNDWYEPLLNLYFGKQKVTPEQVLVSGERPHDKCIAHFFVAEWHLDRDENEAAARTLKQAVEICPKDAVELGAVKAELKRIKA